MSAAAPAAARPRGVPLTLDRPRVVRFPLVALHRLQAGTGVPWRATVRRFVADCQTHGHATDLDLLGLLLWAGLVEDDASLDAEGGVDRVARLVGVAAVDRAGLAVAEALTAGLAAVSASVEATLAAVRAPVGRRPGRRRAWWPWRRAGGAR